MRRGWEHLQSRKCSDAANEATIGALALSDATKRQIAPWRFSSLPLKARHIYGCEILRNPKSGASENAPILTRGYCDNGARVDYGARYGENRGAALFSQFAPPSEMSTRWGALRNTHFAPTEFVGLLFRACVVVIKISSLGNSFARGSFGSPPA